MKTNRLGRRIAAPISSFPTSERIDVYAVTFSGRLGLVGLCRSFRGLGKLKNVADASKTISYSVNDSKAAFTSAKYTAAGQETPLTIAIAKDEWNKAAAGSYSDTVTFTVSYVDTTAIP